MTLRIGIDFDNTIVNYDGLFSKVAKKLKLNLDSYPAKKELIKKKIFKKKKWFKNLAKTSRQSLWRIYYKCKNF